MSADRIAKLRRMAEHPTSNPNEAAIARAEMERLIAEQPVRPEPRWNAAEFFDNSYSNDRADPFDVATLNRIMRDWARRRATPPPPSATVPPHARRGECFVCKVKLANGWIDMVSATLCPTHHYRMPGI